MHLLHLPRLGQTMERGTILRWLKQVGEPYQIGEPLYELEYEKATVEVEAKLPGMLARVVAAEGENLPIGALLALVADPGESLSAAEVEAALAAERSAQATTASEPPPAAPAAAPPAPPGRIRVMPRARALAQQLGVDLAAVQGTGAEGVITVEDVQRAAAAGPRVRERRPLRGIPQAMAETMTRSWQQIPQFVQMVLVDASALAARRRAQGPAVKEQFGVDLSYTDLILQAVAQAACEVPEVNASFAGDSLVLYEDVNLAVAVATDAGLVVPVIHRAQALSLGNLAQQLREVGARARAGTLRREDVEGGTITVSNLGPGGPETGTPLIMPPQAAIVFVGAIVERAVVVDGAVVARPTFYLSNAFDHRVLDGATAAHFTGALKRLLEQP